MSSARKLRFVPVHENEAFRVFVPHWRTSSFDLVRSQAACYPISDVFICLGSPFVFSHEEWLGVINLRRWQEETVRLSCYGKGSCGESVYLVFLINFVFCVKFVDSVI